jgi:hypothetical protein
VTGADKTVIFESNMTGRDGWFARMYDHYMEQKLAVQRVTKATAIRYRNGALETVEIGADGKIIEPCRKCGPILCCSEHLPI